MAKWLTPHASSGSGGPGFNHRPLRCFLRQGTLLHFERLPCVRKISVKNFRQMVLVFFLAPKTGTGLSCTIYEIPVNFPLSLDLKPGTGNPIKWYRKFRSLR